MKDKVIKSDELSTNPTGQIEHYHAWAHHSHSLINPKEKQSVRKKKTPKKQNKKT